MKITSQIKKQKSEIEFVDTLYKTLLGELSFILNNFHNVKWNLKSWETLIGPWLSRYIAVIVNRYKNKNNYKNLKITNNKYSLACSDLSEFTLNIQNVDWNKYLVKRIKKVSIKKKSKFFIKLVKPINSITKFYLSQKITFIFLRLLLSILCFNNKFVFYKPYFGKSFRVLRLFLSLKEVPFIYDRFLDNRWFFPYDKNLRKKIKIRSSNKSVEEKIVRSLLIESMPTIYLEGFKKMNSLAYKTLFPKKTKIIFTGPILKDNLFKFWSSAQISKGTKLIIKQHGTNYGQIRDWDHEKHEISISNKYLTYGWNSNNKKIFSSCNFYSFKTKNYKDIKNKKILVVPGDLRFYKTNNIFFDENINNTLKLFDNFLKKFDKKELKNIFFKSHPLDSKSNFYLENYLKKKYKINYLNFNSNLDDLFNKFELIIFFYNSTDFLKMINTNKMAISVNNKFFYKTLNKPAFKKFNILKNNCLFFDNTNILYNHLKTKNLVKWWNSKKTCRAKKLFKDQFSNSSEKNYSSTLKYLKKLKEN